MEAEHVAKAEAADKAHQEGMMILGALYGRSLTPLSCEEDGGGAQSKVGRRGEGPPGR